MRVLGLALGVLVVLIGAAILVAPGAPVALARVVVTPTGLYVVAAVRIALGLFMVLAAPVSRAPRTLRVIGVLVIAAGLVTPWFGVERGQAVLDWAASTGWVAFRVFGVALIAIGGFLVHVFRPASRDSLKPGSRT